MENTYLHIEDFLEDQSFRNWVYKGENDSFWKEWMKKNPDKTGLVRQARSFLLEMSPDAQHWEAERMQLFYHKLEKSLKEVHKKKHPVSTTAYSEGTRQMPVQWSKFLFAAMVIVSLGLIGLSYADLIRWGSDTKGKEVSSQKEAWISKTVPHGQKSKIYLPDGSIITINSNSLVRYRSGFGTVHRDIFLEGESFFEVKKDSLLPFKVFTEHVTTTALGTSFNIIAYPEKNLRVQLATGQVEVTNSPDERAKNDKVYLAPGEEAVMQSEQEIIKQKFDLATAFLWKDGILYFNKTPFP